MARLNTRLGKIEKTAAATATHAGVLHVAKLEKTGLYMLWENTKDKFDYRAICRPLAGLPEDFTLSWSDVEEEAARRGLVASCGLVVVEGGGQWQDSTRG